MEKYESVCILAPECEGERTSEMIVKIQNKISKLTNRQTDIEIIGKKKLAYEVKGNKEGIYIIVNFEMDLENILELERFYRITDEILKFIVVRKDD